MRVEVRLLGGFGVTVAGRESGPEAWSARRAVQLVALLALARNHRLPADEVMDLLWRHLPADAARANLHKAATLARRAVGNKDAIVLRGGVIALWPTAEVTVDAVEFERVARAALGAATPAQCAKVADAYPGDLLPDERYEEWVSAPRERLRRLHLELLRCAERWADVIEREPTDEEAHRALMREHYRNGRLHAAVRQFQRLRMVLATELAAAPAPETRALYREIIGSSASGWIRPPLAGREVELVRARAAMRRAAEGRPAAIVVTGAAGIGKTRFCEELVDHATHDGWIVLRALASEQSSALPYGPLVDALDALLLACPELTAVVGADDLALLNRLSGVDAGPSASPRTRHAVLRLITRVVNGARAKRGALFVDDLHQADESTLSLVSVLAGAPPPRGLLVIAACREDAVTSAVEAALGASGSTVHITLGPLCRDETDAIVADVAGRTPTPAESKLVWELSDGNPFVALEIASSLACDAPAPHSAVGGAAVAARLNRLPSAARSALRRVALAADAFDVDELAAVGNLPAEAALDALTAAVATGVVARTDDGRYRFRHSLVRDALAHGATAGERAAAHAAIAEWLTVAGAPPGRIAHHLLAAGRREDAVPVLRRAAADAVGVGAHADAVASAEAALEVAPGDAELLGIRADALYLAGDARAAGAYAVAMAAAEGPARSSLAIRRARALIGAGAVPAAFEALSGVTEIDPADRVQHLVTRGLALWCVGKLDEAGRDAVAARSIAEGGGNLRDFVDAAMLGAMLAHEQGVWSERAALDLLDTQLRPEFAVVVMDAHLCIAEAYLYGGVPYPDVLAFALDLRERAEKADNARAVAFAMTLLGEAHLLMGATEHAEPLLRAAAELHRRVGVLCGEALSLQRLAEALLAAGAPSRAQRVLADAFLATRGSTVGMRHLLDRVYGTAIRAAGESGAALAAVDEAERAVRGPFESCPPCSLNLAVPAAIACADAREIDRARAYLASAEQVVARYYPRGGWHAALDEARAHIARAEGDADVARRLLANAAGGFERWGQNLDAARCRATWPEPVGKV